MFARILLIASLFLVVAGCNAGKNYETSLYYLEKRGFDLRRDGNAVYSVHIDEKTISQNDLRHICNLGSVELLFFRNSRMEKEALKGLEKCDALKSILYEKTSFASWSDLIYHDSIKKGLNLDFFGAIYDDDFMEELGKLQNNYALRITGDQGPHVPGDKGSVTNNGIRRYAESRTTSKPIALNLSEIQVDANAFPYFLQIKGLWYLEVGTGTSITYKRMKQFQDDYNRKYGEEVKIMGPLEWAREQSLESIQ